MGKARTNINEVRDEIRTEILLGLCGCEKWSEFKSQVSEKVLSKIFGPTRTGLRE
jgi:hypothetical protein